MTVDRAQVDQQLNAIGQRVQARRRIGSVQAQVKSEVVAGTGGDHQERQPVLGRDAGHQRLGAVAAGDSEQVGAVRDRLPGYRRHVDQLGAVHQEHLRPQRLRLPRQVEPHHLPAAGSRVHDQVRMPGRPGRELRHAPLRGVLGQRRPRGDPGQQPGRRGNERHPEQAGERVNGHHGQRRRREHRQRQPAQHPPAGQHEERGGHADHGGGQADREHDDALPFGDGEHHRDREEREQESEPGQPASPARAGQGRAGRHRRHRGHAIIVTHWPLRQFTRRG